MENGKIELNKIYEKEDKYKMKSFFTEEGYYYTEDANKLASRLDTILVPVFVDYQERGWADSPER